jgi:hypothetical protein
MELTQEQKDALTKFVETIRKTINELWENIKKLIDEIYHSLSSYTMSLEPRERYKFMKSIGAYDYIPIFRRLGVFRCRNNC